MQKQKFSLMIDDDDVVVSQDASSLGGGGGGGTKETKEERRKRKEAKGKAKSSNKTASTTTARKRDGGGGDAWESDEEERSAKRRREEERWAREDASIAKRAAAASGGAGGGGEGDGAPEEPEEDEATRIERERLADLKERDEFAARMKDKDKDRTKKLVEDRSSKMDAESVARRALAKDPNALENAMPALRDRSRQSYLGKREQQQLDLLRLEIADDERDFKGVKLTRREQEELDRKKELLRLAEERLAVDDGFDGYMMPDGAFLFF